MPRLPVVAITAAACSLALLAAGAASSWEYQGDVGDANAVLVNRVGAVISAGTFVSTSEDLVVMKHGPIGQALWQQTISSGSGGEASLALAPDGSIAAATQYRYGSPNIIGSVVKLSLAGGAIQWRMDLIGARFTTVATDSAGNILAAGSLLNADQSDQALIVVKLDSASGAELWRCLINGAVNTTGAYGDSARAIAVDSKGDVFVGGVLSNDLVSPTDYFVAKVNGATGAKLWGQHLHGTGGHGSYVNSVAVDQAGNVVAGGGMHILPEWIHMVVTKFAGSDGSELWLQDYDPYPGSVNLTYSVAIDPAGDIMTADGLADSKSSVVKLSGLTGGLVWRYDFPDTGIPTGGYGGSRAVRVDAAGNAIAIGAPLADGASYGVIAAAKLSGSTGQEIWRHIEDSAGCGDYPEAAAVGPGGNVAIAGFIQLRQNGVCVGSLKNDYAVFEWNGSTGADLTVASATTTDLLVGFGAGSGGVVSVVGQGFPFSVASSTSRAWAGYNSSVGETRPVACDLYGDGRHEFVVGYGPGGGGWLEVLDSADRGFAHLAWLQVKYPGYNASNGETFPACGDIDGDGRDEIVVGLGMGGGGWLQLFDDATTGYAPMPGTPVAGGWLQVQWPSYDASNGATHPAVGDFDGDGLAEIAVGLGTGGSGWIQVFDDQAHGFAPMNQVSKGWIAPNWPGYDSANGDSYPAACDLDGDGKAELVVGLGVGGGGWAQILDDATTGFAPRSGPGGNWIHLNWGGYNASNGTIHPACADLNGDGMPDILLGLGDGGWGWMQIFQNTSGGFVPMANTPKGAGWILVAPPSGLSGRGATWPALVH